ncbi:unnamed protein product [Paramecium sonneborni]|uniref:Uncharacterized protein n=1 Tax=Paramecium sonneborni TaxID=65129 RepID=A0A8S1QZ06_9CILI|nr:unnamed protein product [Paramecium sonneborni]
MNLRKEIDVNNQSLMKIKYFQIKSQQMEYSSLNIFDHIIDTKIIVNVQILLKRITQQYNRGPYPQLLSKLLFLLFLRMSYMQL